MIDVLHLYVGAGVARVVCAAAADNERTKNAARRARPVHKSSCLAFTD